MLNGWSRESTHIVINAAELSASQAADGLIRLSDIVLHPA
jgi:hypothetical protein